MPDLDGFSVVQALKADPDVHHIPVIMMTARSELASRVQGLDLGAHDYVSKPFETAELVARIRAALRVKQLQDALMHANRKLEQLATSDPLTELPNRRTFDEQFFLAIERSRRSGEPVSVMMIDLDDFKRINDERGHQAGDEALRQIGRVLGGRQRKTDLVTRCGGDEFVWVLPGAAAKSAVELAAWLHRAVEDAPVPVDGGTIELTVSVGITTFSPSEHGVVGANTVLETADQALREAKTTGRNRVMYRELGLQEVVADDAAPDEEVPGVTRYR